MSSLARIKQDHTNVVPFLDHFESEYLEARKEAKLSGSLEARAVKLSSFMEFRFAQLQEIEQVLKYFEIELQKTRSKYFRYYLEGYKRALTARDVEKYVDGEQDVVDLQHVINEVSGVRNKFLAIMKGLDAQNWQIGNVIKIRAAGIEPDLTNIE